MLQIRLSKPPSDAGVAKPHVDTVTVACPDHLVLADLPVAKSLGSTNASAPLKIVGRRSRRQLGERVHFCVRCDLPIAVYGRLSPCEHVFCLDCARSDSLCFLCEERIQKIQTIKMMEGLFICAAPHCLKSFVKKSDFESHIHQVHVGLLHPNAEKDGNDSEAVSARKLAASESTVQGPSKPPISHGSNSQAYDREANSLQAREPPPQRNFMQPKAMAGFPGQSPSRFAEQEFENNPPPGFDRPGPSNHYAQQTFDAQGGIRQDLGKNVEKQIGGVPESGFPDYPMQVHQPTNFAVPVIPGQVLAAQFGYPPFLADGVQQVYVAPYEMGRPGSNQVQGSLLGFPGGPAGAMNLAESYPQPWSMGPAGGTFEPPSGLRTGDGFMNWLDGQGRYANFQGGIPPSNMSLPPPVDKGTESSIQDGSASEYQGGKGILAKQPLPLPPPPPPPPPPFPPRLSHLQQGKFYSNEGNNDGQMFGWSNDKRDGYRNSQEK